MLQIGELKVAYFDKYEVEGYHLRICPLILFDSYCYIFKNEWFDEMKNDRIFQVHI